MARREADDEGFLNATVMNKRGAFDTWNRLRHGAEISRLRSTVAAMTTVLLIPHTRTIAIMNN